MRRIVAESIAFVYAPEGDWVKDEDAPLATATLPSAAEPIADLERQVLDAGGIVLRYGCLYGPGTRFTKDGSWAVEPAPAAAADRGRGQRRVLVPARRRRRERDRGGARARRPRDIQRRRRRSGADHTSGCPYMRARSDAPKPWHAPAWLGRLAAGRLAVEMMDELRGASNARIKRELGWQPEYASWREGFQSALG